MELKGAVAIVTGSATGVGAALVRKLAQQGCHVVINYTRSEAEARQVAGECESLGVDTLLCRADVSVDADCRRMAKEALEKWGRIDILVNNAGTTRYASHQDLEALSAEDFHAIYDVNLIGPYQMVRACAPAMRAQGQGAVVNVSSTAAVQGTGSSMAYAASKGALNTLTKSLARALSPEIRVNVVCPGLIDSRWARQGMGDEGWEKAVKQHEGTPMKRVSQPEDVAEVILWLLQGSAMVTGETVIIDGGRHLNFGML